MTGRPLGLFLIGAGLLLVLIGLLVLSGGLRWFGRLPGDLRVEREHVRVYAPIVSMLLLSAALTLLSWLVGRFRR